MLEVLESWPVLPAILVLLQGHCFVIVGQSDDMAQLTTDLRGMTHSPSPSFAHHQSQHMQGLAFPSLPFMCSLSLFSVTGLS